jgi:hypothetical protein
MIPSNQLPVTIVVPFNSWHEWALDCVHHCTRLVGPNWVIWLLPDDPPTGRWAEALNEMALGDRLHVEPTGGGNPAAKRNVALRRSHGVIFAFIDSDAWPAPDWLANGLALLGGDVAVVAGPNLTPPSDSLSRRLSGRVMESPLGFGAAFIRHRKVARRIVREMPTCNMILRKLEGLEFCEDLNTGEDMMYCSDVRSRGLDVLYDPDVVVFHHRRRMGLSFMRQFFHYGLDKGRLARLSSDISYVWQAFPAVFVLYLAGLAVVTLLPVPAWIRQATLIPLGLYVVAVVVESCRLAKTVAEAPLAPLGFVLGHVSYGTGYLRGLLFPGRQ